MHFFFQFSHFFLQIHNLVYRYIIVKYFRFNVFRSISMYSEVFRSIPKYFEVFRSISMYFEVFQCISKYFNVFRSIPKYFNYMYVCKTVNDLKSFSILAYLGFVLISRCTCLTRYFGIARCLLYNIFILNSRSSFGSMLSANFLA